MMAACVVRTISAVVSPNVPSKSNIAIFILLIIFCFLVPGAKIVILLHYGSGAKVCVLQIHLLSTLSSVCKLSMEAFVHLMVQQKEPYPY